MNHFAEGPAERTLVELMSAEYDMPRLAPDVSKQLSAVLTRTPSELSQKELAHAIARGLCLPPLVRRLLDLVEPNPLASAGWFAGDLLRSLTDMPGWFWRRHPELHDRYREALRAAAAARRALPPDQRLEFWGSIPDVES
jgi:hypothetical protein